MIGLRTGTYLSLAVTTVVGPIVWDRVASGRASANAESQAWALLAETEELCAGVGRVIGATGASAAPEATGAARRPGPGGGRVPPGPPGSAARVAAGEEALEIARELAATVGRAEARRSLVGFSKRSQRLCAGFISSVAVGDRHRSLDGSSRFERYALIAPHLERLIAAATRSGRHHSRQLAPSVPASSEVLASLADRSGADLSRPPDQPSAPRRSDRQSADPKQDRAVKPAGMVVSGGSREHRERLARFARVFSREAGALRAGRRDLQLEIDRMSLAESRAACRAFGAVLANLDSEFEASAPSRGFAVRIARMLTWYRRGVSECAAGRPVAAFVSLSEGDREWGGVASAAARLQPRRPLGLPPSGDPGPSRMKKTSQP